MEGKIKETGMEIQQTRPQLSNQIENIPKTAKPINSSTSSDDETPKKKPISSSHIEDDDNETIHKVCAQQVLEKLRESNLIAKTADKKIEDPH
jgi:hypothetical protein